MYAIGQIFYGVILPMEELEKDADYDGDGEVAEFLEKVDVWGDDYTTPSSTDPIGMWVEQYYHGGASYSPTLMGVPLDKFDECNYGIPLSLFDAARAKLDPQDKEKVDKAFDLLPSKVKARLAKEGYIKPDFYILWSTS